MNISAVVITHNEEKNIEAALKSLSPIASETIVVDGYSSDDTVKIARRYTPHVFERKWTNFADQKNFGNSQAAGPWIFSLDADERVSPELSAEILEMRNLDPPNVGFLIPRRVFYLGRWIKHSGWFPDRKIRLFRKTEARWEGDFVHEKLVTEGRLKKLKGVIYHFTYQNIGDHMDRINRFSDLGAQKLYAGGKKCHWYHLGVLPFSRFLKSYFLKLGFLDGFPGVVIAVLNGYSIFVRYAKLREIWKRGERIEPFPG